MNLQVSRGDRNIFIGDGITVTRRNMHWLDDQRFMSTFNDLAEVPDEQDKMWRTHVFCWAMGQSLKISGDVVQVGVHRGFKAAVAARYLDWPQQDKTMWLYDTWSGVPEDQQNIKRHDNASYQSGQAEIKARDRLGQYANVRLIRGRAPEIFDEIKPSGICCLEIDVNSAGAEVGSLDALYDSLSPGAIVILDDFGLQRYEENCQRTSAWCRQKSIPVVELPTGQGMFIKS